MQVSVESGDGLERTLKVQVPSEQVDSKVDEKLREMRGQVRLQGFRPGKVPMKVVQKRYGPQVRSEVLDEVVRTTYSEALEQESLRPAGTPDIQPLTVEPGKDLEYEARFEVIPDIEVEGVESIELERPAVDIEAADVDRILERLRRQHAEYHPVERAADEGDRVSIDFDGKVDGEDFEGNQGEDVEITLGEGQMPAPFEEGLTGMQAGEQKTIRYTFPDGFPGYHDRRPRGRVCGDHEKGRSPGAARSGRGLRRDAGHRGRYRGAALAHRREPRAGTRPGGS